MALNSGRDTILLKIYHQKTNLRKSMTKERQVLNNDKCLLRGAENMYLILASNDFYLAGSKTSYYFSKKPFLYLIM